MHCSLKTSVPSASAVMPSCTAGADASADASADNNADTNADTNVARALPPVDIDSSPGVSQFITPIASISRDAVHLKIRQRVLEKGRGDSGVARASGHPTVTRDDAGRWLIHPRAADDQPPTPAHGTFVFVRMMNGEMRVGQGSDGRNFHGDLAGGAAYIAYAGTVTFQDGKALEFSNASGTYRPPASLREQAGFDHDTAFQHYKHSGEP